MLNSLKKYVLSFFPSITYLRHNKDSSYTLPNVYLSDANFAQDTQNVQIWQQLNIDLIINVTINDPTPHATQRVYLNTNINYYWYPIKDDNGPIPNNFLPTILDLIHKKKGKNILIHCSAGINRSALVATAILWVTASDHERMYKGWRSPVNLISDMRRQQLNDRNMPLLINPHFYDYIIEFCNNLQDLYDAKPSAEKYFQYLY